MPHDNDDGPFQVRAKYRDMMRDEGHLFGPFDKRKEAEACVLVLAGRDDVATAQIEESD